MLEKFNKIMDSIMAVLIWIVQIWLFGILLQWISSILFNF